MICVHMLPTKGQFTYPTQTAMNLQTYPIQVPQYGILEPQRQLGIAGVLKHK